MMTWLTQILYSEKRSLIPLIFGIAHVAAELEIKVQYKRFLHRSHFGLLLQFHEKHRWGGEVGNMKILNISHVYWGIFSEQKIDHFLSLCLPQSKRKKWLLIAGGNSFTDKKTLFWWMNFLTPFPVFSPVLLAEREAATSCVSAHLIASVSQPQIQLGMCNNCKYSPLELAASAWWV